jgi:hypothetical protein
MDSRRSQHLYRYLCTRFALVYKGEGEVNHQQTAKNLGNEHLRKVVGALFSPSGTPGREADLPKRITTGELVKILTHLRREPSSAVNDEGSLRRLSREDLLTALYKLVELTPEERDDLGLPAGDGIALLQRSLLVLQTTGGLENHGMLLKIYKAAIGLDFGRAEDSLQNLETVDGLIAEVVRDALPELDTSNLKSRSKYKQDKQDKYNEARETRIQELTRKAQREIRRLIARSGNQQLAGSGDGQAMVNAYIRRYLQPAFVRKLTQTLVANEELTDQFPLYLKRITLLPAGPLPFADKQFLDQPVDQEMDQDRQDEGPYRPLLNLDLHRLPPGPQEEPGPMDYELASQEATRVILEFYVKVPEGYKPTLDLPYLISEDGGRIDFTVSSTGIGGTLSHVIKVINRALLHDIPCLAEYFPIAHDLTCTQAIVQDNVASPVWAHSLVKLCRRDTLGETLQAFQPEDFREYEEFSFGDPLGQGDYCGFDFLLCQAQAALQSRLDAIRRAGVKPKDYITQVCQQQERSLAMEEARNCLLGYPFSSLAMIGLVHRKLLRQQDPTEPATTDPDIYFEAYLTIIEALLDEGAYRRALDYLRCLTRLKSLADQGLEKQPSQQEPPVVFSGALVIRYLICLAHYYYLCDPKDKDYLYDCDQDANRKTLVEKAWQTLEKAQRHIDLRLRKYVALNEVSQGTFYPHYLLLSRVLFLRTQLLLFFPDQVPFDKEPAKERAYLPTDESKADPPKRTEESTHRGRLYLAEKARLYAAASGDSQTYACYAAMQAWIYLIASFTLNDAPPSGRSRGSTPFRRISPEDCLTWARRLRDHALITYAEAGRSAYYQIKEKSGLLKETVDSFGFYDIEKIPAIFEQTRENQATPTGGEENFLVLDMALLSVDPADLPKLSPHHPTRKIYLFGTRACYLFFIRGLWMLCSNVNQEFDRGDSPPQEIDWGAKFSHAARLLHVAWTMAEEGGMVHSSKDPEDGVRRFRITRPFSNTPDLPVGVSNRKTNAIRDLYPQRVGEIADLAKVFAVAAMVLQLFLPEARADRPSLQTDIELLLNSLHSSHNLTHSPPENRRTQRALLKQQNRYNPHLEDYLREVARCLRQYKRDALTNNSVMDTPREIQDRRDRLVRELFSALMNKSQIR